MIQTITGDRDLPEVEQKNLSYLRPRELVRAKLVGKMWHQGIGRYLNHLKTSHKDEEFEKLLRKSMLEPVDIFITITLLAFQRP